jgi:tetratricopeptide (TPR) repeat protein
LTAKLDRMMDYLAADPGNRALMRDIVDIAYANGQFQYLDAVVAQARLSNVEDAQVVHALGLSQLARGQLESALTTLSRAAQIEAHPTIAYNLAHARACHGDYEGALALLDDALCVQLEQAVTLRLTCLHHLHRPHEMMDVADRLHAPPSALGALAAALFDLGDEPGALAMARQAPDSAEGATVLGLLALSERNNEEAAGCFTRALAAKPSSARAQLGLGLVHFAQQDFDPATAYLDAAAQSFASHAGSWLAAGWAHLLAGSPEQARARFESASQVDRGFAEALGALAVLEALQEKLADAQRYALKAERLDPQCHSALLARSLIAAGGGKQAAAQQLLQELVSRPLASDVPSISALINQNGPLPATDGAGLRRKRLRAV